MDFLIRKATEKDARSMLEVLNPIIAAGKHTVMEQEFSLVEQIKYIHEFPKRGVFHVAVSQDKKILGLQDVTPFSSENALKHVGVISTFVSLSSHRNGVGRSLSQATFQEAKKLGFLKINATVRADNPTAISFYLKQGFKIIGTAQKHAFLGGKYIDEVLMETFIDSV